MNRVGQGVSVGAGYGLLVVVWVLGPGCLDKTTTVIQGGASGSSGGGTGGEFQLPACPEEAPPKGVLGRPVVRAQLADGRCFWIDQLEVTSGEYSKFAEQAKSGTPQPPECKDNLSFDIGPECSPPTTSPDKHPVACIDWCDAAAFCKWDGKALCRGKDFTVHASNPAHSTWFAACAGANPQALRLYPYGKSYEKSSCVGESTGTQPAGDAAACVSAIEARDLSGNVAEWTEECQFSGEASSDCLARGGSYDDDPGSLRCSDVRPFPRNQSHPTVGFRCCINP